MRTAKTSGALVLVLIFVAVFASRADQTFVMSSVATESGSEETTAMHPAQTTHRPHRFVSSSSPLYLPIISYPAIAIGFAYEVWEIVNEARADAGCAPLALNHQLTEAANNHTLDMAYNDFFSHTGSNGSSPWQRIIATGYQYSAAGENIAAGYATPEAVMAGWMNSSGHRANILNCNFQEIGVSHVYLSPDTGNVNYHHYWTQVFARPAN